MRHRPRALIALGVAALGVVGSARLVRAQGAPLPAGTATVGTTIVAPAASSGVTLNESPPTPIVAATRTLASLGDVWGAIDNNQADLRIPLSRVQPPAA